MGANEDRAIDLQHRFKGNDNSRRNLLKVGVTFAALLVIAGIAAVTKSLINPPTTPSTQSASTQRAGSPLTTFPRVKVANSNDLKSAKSITFNYPLEEEPNILVKLGVKAEGGVGPDGDIVAFSQICQHLGCIYGYLQPGTSPSCDASYTASGPVGYCCCHGTVLDFVNGAKVTAGPSPRPQPQVILEFDNSTGNIYATGMKPPTVFGHNTGSNDVSHDLEGGTPVS